MAFLSVPSLLLTDPPVFPLRSPSYFQAVMATQNLSSSYASSTGAHTVSTEDEVVLLQPIAGLRSFLTLLPVQSSTYPTYQPLSLIYQAPPSPESSASASPKQGSVSGTDSSTGPAKPNDPTMRFLKLGPVHFGGEPGVGDYADHEV